MRAIFRVADFAASVAFYRDGLGMEELKSWDRPEGAGIILRSGPDQELEFFGPPASGHHDHAIARGTELAFQVQDVDSLHDRLRETGIPIARGLVDNPWGDRSFGVDDPDGVRIWFYQLIEEG